MIFTSNAMEPPEYDGPWSCSECGNWMPGEFGCGVCAVALGRFYEDEIENTPKYQALGIAVDWVLGHLISDEAGACDEFREA